MRVLDTKNLGLWTKIAAGLCVLSFGLPWIITNGTSSSLIPGWFTPGFCSTSIGYDGWSSMSCDPGFVGAPMFIPGSQGSTGAGAQTTGRFGIAAALVSLFLSRQTGNRKLLGYGGFALLWTAALSTGTGGITSGVLVAWMASGILLWQGSFGLSGLAKLQRAKQRVRAADSPASWS
jgi:hypothetical protein